jgi:hypothetical protein
LLCSSCFLVTYYFTQKILAQYSENEGKSQEKNVSLIDEEAASLAKKCGSHDLQIYSCLSCSAAIEADTAIKELLKVTSHDASLP